MKADAKPRTFPLSMAGEHVPLRVVAIEGHAGLVRRVAEIGLRVGSTISVRDRQGGGLVVACGEARYALGAGMAHRILVCEAGPEGEA